MAIFSKLTSTSARTANRLSVLAATARAKVGPRLPSGSTVVSGIKVSFAVATTLGLSVPYMQGIFDAATQIMAHADGMKTNRKECKRIAAFADEVVRGLLAATEGVAEEDLTEPTRLNLADLEWKLERAGDAMAKMRKESLVRRFLSKDEHAAKLVEHRQALQDAVSKFQVMQLVRVDCSIARLEKNQDVVVNALRASALASGELSMRGSSAGIKAFVPSRIGVKVQSEWLFVAMIYGALGASENPAFF